MIAIYVAVDIVTACVGFIGL